MIGRCDSDVIDVQLQRLLVVSGARYVAQVKKLVAAWESRFKLAERVSLYLAEWYVEVYVLRVSCTRRDRNVPFADYICEIRVVAGMRTENEADTCVLICIHRSTTCANADTHDSVIRQESIQVPFGFLGSVEDQDNRWRYGI